MNSDVPAWVAAIAAVAVAVIAIIAIVANYMLVGAANKQAAASDAGVTAARQMLVEIQRDRELAHAPYLVFEEPQDRRALVLTNIGRGPALDCRACRLESKTAWLLMGPFAIGAGERVRINRIGMKNSPPAGIFSTIPHGDTVFCRDQFGAMYRFDDGGVCYEVVREEQDVRTWSVVWKYRGEPGLVVARDSWERMFD